MRDISFELRRGEILGLAGLVGSGRTELALTIFGITPATSGEIALDGQPVAITSPRQARDLGIAYVPEDRGLQGLVRPMTIARERLDGLAPPASPAASSSTSAPRPCAPPTSIKRLGIRARGPAQVVGQLSGGNQQKVVLGKWLATEPRILIMDEPTRGIDVGAKAEIHALMGRLAREGLAILMISTELPEVLGMSDRVLVMNGGRIVATIDRAEATPETVGAAMTRPPPPPRRAPHDRGRRPLPAPRRSGVARFVSAYGQEIVIAGAIVALFVVVSAINPRFLGTNNLNTIFSGNAYIAVAAIGMSMVIISGHIDVSVGSLIGVLATISGTLAVSGYPIWVAWIAAGPHRRGGQRRRRRARRLRPRSRRSSSRSACSRSCRGGLISVTGGAWINNLPPDFQLAQARLLGIPAPIWFMVVLTILAFLWMRYTAFGRSIYAIGGNPEAARAAGIPVERRTVQVFAIHGAFAGIATMLFATQLQVIQSTVPPEPRAHHHHRLGDRRRLDPRRHRHGDRLDAGRRSSSPPSARR